MSVGNGTSVHTANPNLIQHGLTAAAQNHPLEAFFGPYNGTSQDMRADDALAHETYNLPESYRGRNKFLERVLDYKIRKEDEFYTRALLPWEYTDDLHVAWEIFSFNRTLADLSSPRRHVTLAHNKRHTRTIYCAVVWHLL